MDWNLLAHVALELIKFIGLCFWLGLTLKGVWAGLLLTRDWFASQRQLRRIGDITSFLRYRPFANLGIVRTHVG